MTPMTPDGWRRLVQAAWEVLTGQPDAITNIVVVSGDGGSAEILEDGKWIKGKLDRNIRIDQPTDGHDAGQPHAHVYGRNPRQELVIVNMDGTASHGKKGRLSPEDAEALKARGWTIRRDRIVEYFVLPGNPQLLLECSQSGAIRHYHR